MDLRLSPEQSQLVDSFRGILARESSPERVRAVEETGFDHELWRRLGDLGAVEMAVEEAQGGWGATLLDLALVAEQLGRGLASAPVIEAQVALRALGRCGEAGAERVKQILSEGLLVTFAPRVAAADGVLRMVPAGAVADLLLARVDGALVLLPLQGRGEPARNLASMSLADVVVDGGDVIARSGLAESVFERALDEWLLLTAAALVGMAARSLEMAVEYAKERTAFGAPIGSFQSIAHTLADRATSVDGARLLVYEAACAPEHMPERAAELATMAFAFSAQVARETTYSSLHVHGGYGFIMEHDVQLYYRRARGWAHVYGDTDRALDRLGCLRYGEVRSPSGEEGNLR